MVSVDIKHHVYFTYLLQHGTHSDKMSLWPFPVTDTNGKCKQWALDWNMFQDCAKHQGEIISYSFLVNKAVMEQAFRENGC